MPEYLIRYWVNPSKQPDNPKVLYEATKAAMAGANELMKAGIFKPNWGTGIGAGVAIAKFPSLEEAYKLGNRWWPMMTMEIQELIPFDKVQRSYCPLRRKPLRNSLPFSLFLDPIASLFL